MRITPIRERNPVSVAIVGLLVLALVALAAWRSDSLPFVQGGTSYSADFTESAGLTDGDEVRIAGVKVGEVTGVSLDGAKVRVDFRVKDAWIGDSSTVGIAVKTLLGDKYLAVDPLGDAPQDPGSASPRAAPPPRTTSPRRSTGSGRPSGRSTPHSSPRASRRSPPPSRTPRPTSAAPPTGSPPSPVRFPNATPSSPPCSATANSSPRPSPGRRAASKRSWRTGTCCSARSGPAATPSICCSPEPATSEPSSPDSSGTTTSSSGRPSSRSAGSPPSWSKTARASTRSSP